MNHSIVSLAMHQILGLIRVLLPSRTTDNADRERGLKNIEKKCKQVGGKRAIL